MLVGESTNDGFETFRKDKISNTFLKKLSKVSFSMVFLYIFSTHNNHKLPAYLYTKQQYKKKKSKLMAVVCDNVKVVERRRPVVTRLWWCGYHYLPCRVS